jgi:phospholipase/carboxylesterase
VRYGAPVTTRLEEAAAALVFLHGRGQRPEAAERFAERLGVPGLALVAPAATDRSWYPQRYFDPRRVNEPELGHAHDRIGSALDDLAARGMPPERIIFGGFSQGACVALDLLATAPRQLGTLVSLCGCLIGADDVRVPSRGSLAGVRALLTGAEADSWVDPEDVRVAAEAMRSAGAEVDLMITGPGEHRVRDEEVEAVRTLVETVMDG